VHQQYFSFGENKTKILLMHKTKQWNIGSLSASIFSRTKFKIMLTSIVMHK